MKRLAILVFLIICSYIVVLTCIVGCANMGSGPDGGPFDETPPRIVSMTLPSQVAHNMTEQTGKQKKKKKTKFSLTFSELVTIDNPTENVIVSPPQIEMPNIQAVGKKINVELLDSLKPNTTYTIDFSDAIKDSNEGNPLGHFTYIFSTGAVTDTMEMSGYVLNAEDLEPVAGILVGLHPVPTTPPLLAKNENDSVPLVWDWMSDTLFTTTPFDRVARTDGSGYFSIKGVKDGQEYYAYALKDADGDFCFSQRSEQIAFSRRILTPGSFPDTRYDTVWIDSVRYDSIRTVPYTHYTPDDIILLAFQEANQPRYRLKEERQELENFKVWFSAPSTHVPVIHGINFDERGSDGSGAFFEQRSVGNDTLVYWLRDTLLMQQDTLRFTYEHMAWDDSLQIHQLTSDTLELVSKTPWKKRVEAQQKEDEKWQKQLEKRHKRGDYSQESRPTKFLTMKCSVGNSLAPNGNVFLNFDQPLDTIIEAGVHLYLKEDSILTPAEYLLEPVENNVMSRCLMAEWRPDQQYQLRIDSACIRTIYGVHNNTFKQEFKIENLDKFGTYFVTLTGFETPLIKSAAPSPALQQEETAVTTPDSLATDSLGVQLSLDTLALDSLKAAIPLDSIATALSADSVAADLLPPHEREEVGAVIIQLLDRSGNVAYSVAGDTLNQSSVRADFYYLKEGEYFMCCIIDRNGNGKWDPGLWSERVPPEDVYFYPKSIEVRAGWDVNDSWDISAEKRYLQKPSSLVKQKKKDTNKMSAHERNIQRLEDRRSGKKASNNSNGFGGGGLGGFGGGNLRF